MRVGWVAGWTGGQGRELIEIDGMNRNLVENFEGN